MHEQDRLVIVANRLPVHRAKRGRSRQWESSPGGLVSALTPILRDRGGSWIGWSGSTGRAPRPFVHEDIQIKPVGLSVREADSFYNNFSNRTLWPLYHDLVRTPEFQRQWWWPYVDINRRFSEAAASQVERVTPDRPRPRRRRRGQGQDLVWVHDYHLQLVPRMLREQRPGARIGFFLHIPFPPDEIFAWLPWRRQVLEGVLGADVIGFQTKADAEDFVRAARRFTSATGTLTRLEFGGRQIQVGAFPISIDADAFEALAGEPDVIEAAASIRSRVGGTRKIILCVDRLDYTKGIDARLRAFEDGLQRRLLSVDTCVLIQVAVPSREGVHAYADTRALVEGLVGRINGQFSVPGRVAVHYHRRNLSRRDLAAFYLAADVMLVTPLRDGMNLVAKEYVATRRDGSGVLILSEFAGAAVELGGSGALIVNPYDLDGVSATLRAALDLSPGEAKKRMTSLRRVVKSHDVYDWAGSFLGALAR